jgi:hypothetical protein
MPDQHAIKNAIPDLTRSELVAHVRAFVAIARADSDSHRSWVFRPESLEPEALESTPNRKQIRNIVGGWLTTSSMEMLPGYTMYVHDEALMVPEPTLNFMATMLYNTGHPICGTVVLVPYQTQREDAP